MVNRTECAVTMRDDLSICPVDAEPVKAITSCSVTWSSRSPALPQMS